MAIINILTNTTSPGQIGSLVLDVTLSDSFEIANEVTDFPVEEGYNINDHINRKPHIVTIEGYITETPVKFISELIKATFIESSSRTKTAFEKLLKISGRKFDHDNQLVINNIDPEIIEIITSDNIKYSNMVITSLVVRSNESTGDAFEFTAQFKPIIKVQSKNVTIPKLNVNKSLASGIDNHVSKSDKGKQTPKPLKSNAASLVDNLVKTFSGGK